MTTTALTWIVFDADNEVVGAVAGREKPEALAAARRLYGPRLAERVQSLTDVEFAALDRDALKKRRRPQ